MILIFTRPLFDLPLIIPNLYFQYKNFSQVDNHMAQIKERNISQDTDYLAQEFKKGMINRSKSTELGYLSIDTLIDSSESLLSAESIEIV